MIYTSPRLQQINKVQQMGLRLLYNKLLVYSLRRLLLE